MTSLPPSDNKLMGKPKVDTGAKAEGKGKYKDNKRRKGLSRADAEAIRVPQWKADLARIRRADREGMRQAELLEGAPTAAAVPRPPFIPEDFEEAPQSHSDDEVATTSSDEVVTIFMLSDAVPSREHKRVCVDSGAARSACPPSYAADVPVSPAAIKLSFQTASGEILEHYGSKKVPYDLGGLGNLGINYEVTDVCGPVASVSSMNDAGLTVVFTPSGSWVSGEAPIRPTKCVDMVREQRTFWLDAPWSTDKEPTHLMPLRQEQAVAVAPQCPPSGPAGGLAGGDQPAAEGAPEPKRRPQPKGPTGEERTSHELTHVVFRSWCRHCVSTRAKEDPHRRAEKHEGGTHKEMMDRLFRISASEPDATLPVQLIYDSTSGAVTTMQLGKDRAATTAAREPVQRRTYITKK